MIDKEKRNELIQRFLVRSETKIEESDYEFLFNFDTYKEAILNNLDKDIFLVDNGKHTSTSWALYHKENISYYICISDTLQNSIIKNKIEEFYPYNEEELLEIKERNRKLKKLYLPTDKAPGKYKDKTWKEVKELDPGYINWMLSATKDKLLKNMLILL